MTYPSREELLAVALMALVEHGIEADVTDLLIRGSLSRGIPPGALDKAISAALRSSAQAPLSEPVAWQYCLLENGNWSEWLFTGRHFHDAIAADKVKGLRQDYKLRALYAALPASSAKT